MPMWPATYSVSPESTASLKGSGALPAGTLCSTYLRLAALVTCGSNEAARSAAARIRTDVAGPALENALTRSEDRMAARKVRRLAGTAALHDGLMRFSPCG